MIENVAILYSVTKTLKDNFPKNNILIDDNEEEIKIPTFHVKVSPLKSKNQFNWRNKLLNIHISFIEKVKKQESSLRMMDSLAELFDENIYIDSIALPILEKDINNTDDSVNMTMTLNFFDERTKPDITPDTIYDALMEILKLNIIEK